MFAFGALLIVAVAGFVVGSRVQSPEQAASNAAPPDASWISAPVERRVLARTVITRGDVRPQVSVPVGVPSSVEGAPVLTGVAVATGDVVSEGTRLAEVSGRPVFVLQGEVPVYRALRPGMAGADVAQLQAALQRLGLEPDTDGRFGPATKAAVSAFYEAAGYEPIPASSTQAADLAAAEQAVTDAEAAVTMAQVAFDQARAGQSPSAIAQAESVRNQAQRGVNQAKADQTDQVVLAQQSLEAAMRERDRLAADPAAEPGALDQAQLAVSQAHVELDRTRRSTQDAVDAANESLWVAALALNEAKAAGDVTGPQGQLETAIASRDRMLAARDAMVAASGPTIAHGEVVFVPTLPARVQQAITALGPLGGAGQADGQAPGAATSGSLATLSAGELVVAMTLRPGEIGLVRGGMQVELLDEQSNTTYAATITEAAATAAVGADGQLGTAVVVTPDEPLPPLLSGTNLRVTITAASTATPMLVVPLAAVSSAADGTTNVSVLPESDDASETVVVAVTTGLSADGFVAVAPVPPAVLVAGDRVVVGR